MDLLKEGDWVTVGDENGKIPLHHAYARNLSMHLIDLLLAAYPEGAARKDKNDKTPSFYSKINTSTPLNSIQLKTEIESDNVQLDYGTSELISEIKEQNIQLKPETLELKEIKSQMIAEMTELKSQMIAEISDMKNQITTELTAQVNAEVTELKRQMKSEIREMKNQIKDEVFEMKAEIGEIKSDLLHIKSMLCSLVTI